MAKAPAKIHLAPHFHYDPVRIEDQRTYTNQAFDLVQQFLDACRADDGYSIILSEMDYLRPFLAGFGEHRSFFDELVASGRIAAGGSYNQANEMSIQGEPLIRNILYGCLYHDKVLGFQTRVYLPFDVFGHCIQLPQILARSGFQAAVSSKNILGAQPLCFGMSPDGTKLLQKQEPYAYYPASLDELLDTVVNGFEHQAKLGITHDLRLFGHDMSGPSPWLTGKSAALAERDPIIELSTPDKYFAAVEPEIELRKWSLNTSGRDFSWCHMGTLVSRADLKIANRLTENRLLSAERWATFASLLGAMYPDAALDKAWRQVLFGQHHDAVTGTSSDIPFLDLLLGYREALDLATEVEDRALRYVSSRIDTTGDRRAPRDGAALVVFNPMSWTRTDVCRAKVALDGAFSTGFKLIRENGREIPFQIENHASPGDEKEVEIVFLASDVPSLGYQTYYLAPASSMPATPESTESSDASIENQYLRITADGTKGGGITSLYDKRIGKEFINTAIGPANELVALAEKPDRERASWELFTTGEKLGLEGEDALVEVALGPVYGRIRTTTRLPDRCDVIHEVTLYEGIPRVDLRTTLNGYAGTHELLALTFPLDVVGALATFEDRFATVVRRRSAGKFDFRTLWEKNLSACGLGAAQNWVDVGPAPALHILSGRRRVGSVPLGPCAVITAPDSRDRKAAEIIQRALLSRGITCEQRLDSDDLVSEQDHFRFCISLGRNEYSTRLLAQFRDANSRLERGAKNASWNGVLLRASGPNGSDADVPVLVAQGGSDTSELADALAKAIAEDRLELRESNDFSELSEPVDDAGLALINRGTIAASLERDGTLIAPFFHTSSWSTFAWGEGKLDRFFVPEHKSHVFEHSLFPHASDWRSGGVVRVGHEVNHPLRAVQAPISEGHLPRNFSPISIDQANVVVAALKPLGNPLAEHRMTARSNPSEGLLVRLYEAEGRPTSADLEFPSVPEVAWLTDLAENKSGEAEVIRPRWGQAGKVRLDVPANGIVSVGIMPTPISEAGPPKELGPSTELCSPIHARYWDHNLGAAPMGNQPVTLWVRGPVSVGETTRFSLGLANDATDKEISGSVMMIAPEAWTMIPRQLPYRIQPNSPAVYEVMVVVPPDAAPGYIRAQTQQGEQIIQDVIPVGDIQPLKSTLERTEDGFLVRIGNPNADYVEGFVALVTPVESWGEAMDTYARCEISPRFHSFRIEAGAEREFPFTLAGDPEGLWAVAKVAWYGNVQYVQPTGSS